ncbi:hypothetical protein ACVWA8_15080, partial [Enterococcus faecalis]
PTPHREKVFALLIPTQYSCLIQSAKNLQDPLSNSFYPGYKSGLRTPLQCRVSLEVMFHSVVVQAWVGKEFPDMRQERRIKFVRVGQAVRTVGQLKGQLMLNRGT